MTRNDYLQLFWNEINQATEEYIEKGLPELLMEDFELFFVNGNRLTYENKYFGRRKYLTALGIKVLHEESSENNSKNVELLSEVILSVCNEKFWALPAHVNRETKDELTIDLFAAETAQTLSEMVYLMSDKLADNIIERVLAEVNRRVLTPFIESQIPYSWWEHDRCNWSAVCAGSIGMTAIYMNKMMQLSDENKSYCIKRVCDSMDCYLDGMEDDGACTEGLGYFSYGMSYYTAFAELLYRETNGSMNLMKKAKCEKIAMFQQKCYFGKGVSLSFSDGAIDENFLPGLTAYLAYCFDNIETPDYSRARLFYADSCYRWVTNERNIRWIQEYVKHENEICKSEVANNQELKYDMLPSAQWFICKDNDGNGFAAKGGNNDENHNHNDIGHFVCVYNGDVLLTDLGAGEYTKDYFNENRYGILCNRSLGHSVPLINGSEQCTGKEYMADEFWWDEDTKELKISFASAYQEGLIDKIDRKIAMVSNYKSLELQISDAFVKSSKTNYITENLITTYLPIVKDNQIKIEGEHAICQIYVENVKDIHINTQIHSTHSGDRQEVYLIQWDVQNDLTMTICDIHIICKSK